MDRRTALRTIGGVGLGLSLAGCLDSGASAGTGTGGDHDVGMSTRKFLPPTITVAPGEAVVWKNTSSHAHTVTAYGDRIPADAAFFASGDFETTEAAQSAWFGGGGGALYSGDTFEHTFEVPGTYHYFCIPHEASGMVGVVEVGESGTETG